jgi:hypothetical protein
MFFLNAAAKAQQQTIAMAIVGNFEALVLLQMASLA